MKFCYHEILSWNFVIIQSFSFLAFKWSSDSADESHKIKCEIRLKYENGYTEKDYEYNPKPCRATEANTRGATIRFMVMRPMHRFFGSVPRAFSGWKLFLIFTNRPHY